jgi:hypothetical protein
MDCRVAKRLAVTVHTAPDELGLMPRVGLRGLAFARARVEVTAIEPILHLRRDAPAPRCACAHPKHAAAACLGFGGPVWPAASSLTWRAGVACGLKPDPNPTQWTAPHPKTGFECKFNLTL